MKKPQAIKLDARDIKILSILQNEGRITKAALAQRVNLSQSPCWERLKRLEKAGIIEGYGARISPLVFKPSTMFFMQAELSSHKAEDFVLFENALDDYDEIEACWAVGGGIDYLLSISVADVDAYQRLVDQILDAEIGLKRYYTYVVTKTVKQKAASGLSQALASEYLADGS